MEPYDRENWWFEFIPKSGRLLLLIRLTNLRFMGIINCFAQIVSQIEKKFFIFKRF